MKLFYILLFTPYFINAYNSNNNTKVILYKNIDDCNNNTNSILNYSTNIDINCRCVNLDICKRNIDTSNLIINYNNSKIHLNNLNYNNVCDKYNNIYYKYDITLFNTCILNIFIIFSITLFIFIIGYVMFFGYQYNYHYRLFGGSVKQNNNPPSYDSI